jgi:hypothetical protein
MRHLICATHYPAAKPNRANRQSTGSKPLPRLCFGAAKRGEASHACFDTSDRAPAFREHDTGKCVVVQRGGSQLQGIGGGEPAWGSFELRSGTGFLHEDGDICRPVQRQDVEQLAEEIANRQPAFL